MTRRPPERQSSASPRCPPPALGTGQEQPPCDGQASPDTDLDARVAELVADAPPLTSAQRDQLALILGRGWARRAAGPAWPGSAPGDPSLSDGALTGRCSAPARLPGATRAGPLVRWGPLHGQVATRYGPGRKTGSRAVCSRHPWWPGPGGPEWPGPQALAAGMTEPLQVMAGTASGPYQAGVVTGSWLRATAR